MDVAPVAKETYGTFYSGDCYIVLRTHDVKGRKVQDLHFWLGNNSSQDEAGAAALKTVELDQMLGDLPTQYREVQGSESDAFLGLFRNGIKYLDGGIESGFNKVDPNAYKPRLLQIKGKRRVRVQEVAISGNSLNDGDVFILDAGLNLFQWNGKSANRNEKFKALEVVTAIRNDERGGKAVITVLDSGAENDAFWKELGGQTTVKSAADGGSDDEHKDEPTQLLRVSDASGSITTTLVASGQLQYAMLDQSDVFIVDNGHSVAAWVGSSASKEERAKALATASTYVAASGKPASTQTTRVVSGSETSAFKSLFAGWPEPKRSASSASAPAPALQRQGSVDALYAKQAEREKESLIFSGKVQTWRVQNFAKVDVPADMNGQLNAGDSYVILHTYEVNKKEQFVVYFWQGRDSSQDEKASSALLAKELDDSLNGRAVQVRVVQGKEPRQFLALFQGRMIVHAGGVASGFKNRKDNDSLDLDGVSLFHVKGNCDVNTRAIQVAEVAASLNSGDCFVLVTPSTNYVWCGKGSNEQEKAVAITVAGVLQGGRAVVVVAEGEESEDFWAPLGGKAEYPSEGEGGDNDREPRFFVCSDASGAFNIEEVCDFDQSDLNNDDVCIVDTYSEVYVWIGHNSRKEEKENALKHALEFVQKGHDGRSADTPVFRVLSGSEPPSFTCLFRGWSFETASDFEDPYTKRLRALQAEKDKQDGAAASAAAAPGFDAKRPSIVRTASIERVTAETLKTESGSLDPASNKFPFEQLKPNPPPAGVDVTRKELYLSESEFATVFGMSFDAYSKLPAWKQTNEKKRVGLF